MIDREAWCAAVHGVTKGRTWLSDSTELNWKRFFIVQLSNPFMTTGETIAMTMQTFVDKLMSLPFNMLSRFVTAFLPRSKHLLISWLQLPTAVILEPKKIVCHCFHLFPHFICHEVIGPDAMISVFECWVLSQLFHSPLSLSSRGSLVLLYFLPLSNNYKWSIYIQYEKFL